MSNEHAAISNGSNMFKRTGFSSMCISVEADQYTFSRRAIKPRVLYIFYVNSNQRMQQFKDLFELTAWCGLDYR